MAWTVTDAGAETVPRGFIGQTCGTGSPLVLLHGLASSSRYWAPAGPLLAARHRLLAPDLLGFGRAPKPHRASYRPLAHVAYLHRLLTPLAGGLFDVVGHSAGSLVALHYAAAHPESVRSLSLISLPVIGCLPWGHSSNGDMGALHRLMAHTRSGARLCTAVIRAAGPVGRLLAPRMQRDVPADAARDALSVSAESYWRTLEEVVYGSDVRALLERIHAPVQLLHGENDRTAPFEPVQALAAERPDIELCVIAGAGHNPIVTHTAAVAAAIERHVAAARQRCAGPALSADKPRGARA